MFKDFISEPLYFIDSWSTILFGSSKISNLNSLLFSSDNDLPAKDKLKPIGNFVSAWILTVVGAITTCVASVFLIITIMVLARAAIANAKGDQKKRSEHLSGLWHNVIYLIIFAAAGALSLTFSSILFND